MFQSLRIRNFRSISDSGELNLSAINVFVGPNNSGKSSILYALMLLKMSADEKNPASVMVTSIPELDLGSYLDLVRGGNVKRNLGLAFALDSAALRRHSRYRNKASAEHMQTYGGCQVYFAYDQSENRATISSFSGMDGTGKELLRVRKLSSGRWLINGPSRSLTKNMTVRFSNYFPIIWPTGIPSRAQRKTVDRLLEWRFLSREFAANLTTTFQDLRYIAPIRERIPRYGIMGTMPSSELGPSGQNLMRVLSSGEEVSLRNKTAIREVNYWLNTRFRLLRNIRMVDIDKSGTVKTLIGDDRHGARNINLASTGCGISQLVPVVVHTVLMPEGGCLLVEQPEIHLHPSAQADLADLFVENARHNRQFLIETHSEHFVLRLRRRIAEGKIKPEKVSIFAVEKSKGRTRIQQLNLKPNGHFEEWPEGFFEEGYREALAIAKASQRQ